MKKLIGYGYTNSSGVATLDYDTDDDEIDGYVGTGAGLMNFRAEMHDDSTVVSQPYPVLDALYFDDMSTDTTANYYVNTANNSIAYDSTNKMIKLTGLTSNSLYFDIRSLTSSLTGNIVNIEVDVVLNGLDARLRVLKNGSSLINTPYTASDGTLKLENIDLTDTANSYYIRVETRNTSANDTFSFKNLKIYPV